MAAAWTDERMEKIAGDGSDPLDSVILRFAKKAATRYGKSQNSNGMGLARRARMYARY